MAARANSVLSPTSFDRAHPWQKRRKKEKEPAQACGPRGIYKLSLPIIKNVVGFFNIGEFARNKTINKLFSSVTLVDWQNQQNYVDVCALTCVIRHYSKKPELLANWRTRVKVLEWQIGHEDEMDLTSQEFHQLFPASGTAQFPAIQSQRLGLYGLQERDYPKLMTMARNCPNITRFSLEHGDANQLLLLLQRLPLLTHLDLSQCNISLGNLAKTLKSFPTIQSVTLHDMPCKTDADVEALLSTGKVSRFEMIEEVSDVSLMRIAQNPQVREVSLTYCSRVSEKGVSQLCKMGTLLRLNLHCCGGLQGITALGSHSGLQYLKVSMDDLELKPVSLASVRKCSQLRELVFEDYRDHADTVKMMPNVLKEISQCTQIRALQVRTAFLSKEGNIMQLAPLTQLRSLSISSVREWLGEPNEDEIATLAHGLPRLEALDFNACFGLHRERLRAKLHKEIPGIQIPASQPK